MRADDWRLLGIPRSRATIATLYPKHDRGSADFPDLSARGRHADPVSVACVRPRTSKGITDLLLLSVSYGFRAVNPSKKTFEYAADLEGARSRADGHRTAGAADTNAGTPRPPPARRPTTAQAHTQRGPTDSTNSSGPGKPSGTHLAYQDPAD